VRDTSFYYSFLVLPARKRDAIIAVWDVCRALDDTVDEPGDRPAAEALAEWRTEVARAFEGSPLTPQGRRLQPVIHEFSLSRRPFEDLIDGVEMDLTTSRYPTFEALYEYCWRVASTVGLICIEIFECRNPRSRDYAIALGVALQLTNILRDVATDLERDRIYLPQEDLARFGCTEQDLRASTAGEPVRAVLAHEASRARGD
jgi:phytoene synthase